MKKSPSILIFVCISLVSFGQRGFYINDTSVTNYNTCWALTKSDKMSDTVHNYGFNIRSAEIIENILKLDIEYGGGCGEVFLKLFVDTTQNYKTSVIKLFPEFKDNDMCKAGIYGTFCFNLKELKNKYGVGLRFQVGTFEEILILQ